MMMRSDCTDFTVEGRGDFPLDMLRTDECWPVDADSVAGLIKKEKEDRAPGETTFRRVRLRTERSSNIHPGRWASFNWKVVFIDSERYGITLDQREPAHADG